MGYDISAGFFNNTFSLFQLECYAAIKSPLSWPHRFSRKPKSTPTGANVLHDLPQYKCVKKRLTFSNFTIDWMFFHMILYMFFHMIFQVSLSTSPMECRFA